MAAKVNINHLLLDLTDLKSILQKKEELFKKTVMSESHLPRNIDVLSYLFYLKSQSTEYRKPIESFYSQVVLKITNIWMKSGIKIISYSAARTKIAKLYRLYTDIKRYIHVQKHEMSTKLVENIYSLNNVFNISKCTCVVPKEITQQNDIKNFECKCSAKLTTNQSIFYIDQQFKRILKIENWGIFEISEKNVDVEEADSGILSITGNLNQLSLSSPPPSSMLHSTPRPQQAAESQSRESVDFNVSGNENSEIIASPSVDSSDSSAPAATPDSDPEYVPYRLLRNKYKQCSKSKQIDLPQSIRELDFEGVCIESMRYNTSVRQTAAIVTRTIEMMNGISSNDKNLVVTPALIQRKFKKTGSAIAARHLQENVNRRLLCFFFDGFAANNLMKREIGGRVRIEKTTKFENIVLLEQPNDRYLGFFSTTNSDAETIFIAMSEFFTSQQMDLSTLIAVGCDGAATNVGVENGIVVKLEKYLNRALHRIVCLLHLLELILKAIISYYYGDTIGPQKYSHKINQQLADCEKEPIVKFKPVLLENMPPPRHSNGEDSVLTPDNFKNDQRLLLLLAEAVSSGVISERLSRLQLGSLCDVRWTIYAIRFLRLFMSSPAPSFQLLSVVNFIQKVYVPVLFWIKGYPEWVYGPRHIHKMLCFSKLLPVQQFNVVKARITHNSFFLHSENVLLSMISDNDQIIRRKAYQIILSLRERNVENAPLRKFKKPKSLSCKHPDEVDEEEDYGSESTGWYSF